MIYRYLQKDLHFNSQNLTKNINIKILLRKMITNREVAEATLQRARFLHQQVLRVWSHQQRAMETVLSISKV